METIAWCQRWHRTWLKISYCLDIDEDQLKFRRCISNLLKLAKIEKRLCYELTKTHPVTHV